jgi:nucleoside-diphosphate-sugar epimerase
MERVLVTGGAGFIGSHLVAALLEHDTEVVILDDLSSGRRDLVPEGVEFIEGSVADEGALAQAFAVAPDRVAHLAALFANQNSVDHPVLDIRTNAEGTVRVLEASVKAGVRKVLNVSSSCVYGNKEVMREDDRDLLLDTPYAISKLAGEHYAQYWATHWDLDVVSVRPFNAYGPHEWPGRYRNVVPNFFALALAGEPLTITGTGEETRDFTYVADTAAGMLAALMGDSTPGDVFNLGSGRETRIIEIAARINELAGNDAGMTFVPRRSWDHVTRRVSDIDKARAVLGWEPVVDLDEGLALTHAWLAALES